MSSSSHIDLDLPHKIWWIKITTSFGKKNTFQASISIKTCLLRNAFFMKSTKRKIQIWLHFLQTQSCNPVASNKFKNYDKLCEIILSNEIVRVHPPRSGSACGGAGHGHGRRRRTRTDANIWLGRATAWWLHIKRSGDRRLVCFCAAGCTLPTAAVVRWHFIYWSGNWYGVFLSNSRFLSFLSWSGCGWFFYLRACRRDRLFCHRGYGCNAAFLCLRQSLCRLGFIFEFNLINIEKSKF